jgi:hypothetical protein
MSHDVADFTPSNLVFPAELLARFFNAWPCTREQCNARRYDLCRSQSLSGVSLNWHPDGNLRTRMLLVATTDVDVDTMDGRRGGDSL